MTRDDNSRVKPLTYDLAVVTSGDLPKATEAPVADSHDPPVILDPWEHCDCGEIIAPHLRGVFYNHPYIQDGEWGHTSPLITITGNVAVCQSRTYHLGKPREA